MNVNLGHDNRFKATIYEALFKSMFYDAVQCDTWNEGKTVEQLNELCDSILL